jgi:hypothetical protein
VAEFNEACRLRREGKQLKTAQILDEKLPRLIARWSQADPRSCFDKQVALKAMFLAEQNRDLATEHASQDLAAKLASTLLPAMREHVSQELRQSIAQEFRGWQNRNLLSRRGPESVPAPPRIRFDDIPAVIDALLAEQDAGNEPRHAFAY